MTECKCNYPESECPCTVDCERCWGDAMKQVEIGLAQAREGNFSPERNREFIEEWDQLWEDLSHDD